MTRKTTLLFGTLILVPVAWYYSWAHYVEALPHSSKYYDETHNPIPDALGETPLLATAGFCQFAESAIIATAVPADDALRQVRDAIGKRFGIEETRGAGSPLGALVRGRAYDRIPQLSRWKAKNGSSRFLAHVKSAESAGVPAVSFVDVERVDTFEVWPGRDFHTGILLAIPIRMTVTQAVITAGEVDFLKTVFGSSANDPVLLCPSWEISRQTAALKSLAEKAVAGPR